MDRKILTWLLSATALILLAVIMIPGEPPAQRPELFPWNLGQDAQGHNRVIGLVLGVSTLEEARQLFREEGETALFVEPDGDFFLEAYLKGISLNGLKADLVLNLEVDPDQAAAMFDRGVRMKSLESGNRRVDLASQDQQTLAKSVIRSLTLVPGSDLDPETLVRRFGEPAQRRTEGDSDIVHWLYPDRGLEIVVDPEGKEMLQYVNPDEFDRLVKPLQQ